MASILRPFRLIGVAAVVATFLLAMSAVTLFVHNRFAYIRVANRVLSLWCKMALFVLGVRARVIGRENLGGGEGALFVGNHLTYVDVLVISSNVPACFVTSTEIKRSFGLGHICRMAGCLFVDRKNKRNLVNEVSELQEALKHGLNIAIFPEATSTDGEKILRFRKPLYFAATNAGVNVVPFVLNYRTVGGRPIDANSRDSIFWYGDMDFIPHLWRLTGCGGVEVELNILKPIAVSPQTDAGEIAERTQTMVEAVYLPVKKEGPPPSQGSGPVSS